MAGDTHITGMLRREAEAPPRRVPGNPLEADLRQYPSGAAHGSAVSKVVPAFLVYVLSEQKFVILFGDYGLGEQALWL